MAKKIHAFKTETGLHTTHNNKHNSIKLVIEGLSGAQYRAYNKKKSHRKQCV